MITFTRLRPCASGTLAARKKSDRRSSNGVASTDSSSSEATAPKPMAMAASTRRCGAVRASSRAKGMRPAMASSTTMATASTENCVKARSGAPWNRNTSASPKPTMPVATMPRRNPRARNTAPAASSSKTGSRAYSDSAPDSEGQARPLRATRVSPTAPPTTTSVAPR